MVTFCDECQFVEKRGTNTPPYRWVCTKHKNLFDTPLSKKERTTDPYLLCKNVNGGDCCLFQQKKET